MTHEELIQIAIEQLKANKVHAKGLEKPRVREAAVVYFKIRPDSNCQLVLDRQTGERISAHFSKDPLVEEYMSHHQAALP